MYILFIIIEPKYPPSEPVVKTLEERCQKALYHVGCGLNCLQYFKNLNPQFTDEENNVCYKLLIFYVLFNKYIFDFRKRWKKNQKWQHHQLFLCRI